MLQSSTDGSCGGSSRRAAAARSRLGLGAAVAIAIAVTARPSDAAGTWTKAPFSSANNGPAFGLWLLTDGRVLSHGNALNHWVILTPDAKGSYANGTWKSAASSNYARGGAQEHVLKDGRFFEAGGEFLYVYPGCASGCTNPASGSALYKNAEIYDPVADAWTIEASGLYDIGDTGSATLGDGRILDSTRMGNQIQIFDPTANTWTAGPSSPNQSGDENSWASLQNGGVLAVAPNSAAVYNPATNKWVATGPFPAGLAVTLNSASGYPGTYNFGDAAGISLMFDGRVLAYGLGTTAIYTPGATASDPGTWALGPDIPFKTATNFGLPGNDAEDEYTVTEPSGKVMIATYPFKGQPDELLEFDPTTNTFAAITPPPDPSNAYPQSYLNLPNGQVMITGGSQDWLYTPDTPPQDAWRPVVQSVVFNSGTTYTLTGMQLSGLINGGDEGDDMTMAENYPIVWLTDSSGNVYYCKSFNFSNMMPSKGNTAETCQFTTPPGLPNGTYNLYVSAVGVQSKTPLSFTVGTGGYSDAGIVVSTSSSSSGASSGSSGSSGSGTGSSGGASSGSGSGSSGSSGTGTGNGGGAADAGRDATGGGSGGGNGSGSGSGGNGGTGSSSAGGSSGSTTGNGSGNGGGPASSGGSVDGGDAFGGAPPNNSGCGCSTVGDASGRAGLAAIAGVLGLCGAAARRRPRRKN